MSRLDELIEKLKNKELTSTEITQSYIDRIKDETKLLICLEKL